MFKCQICNKVSKAKEKINKIVLDKRKKTYYNVLLRRKRSSAKMIKHHLLDEKTLEELKYEGWDKIKEWNSIGWEIVREIDVCKECYESNNNKE